MILGFKDSLTEWTSKSLECLIKLGFFPKSEHKFPSLPRYDPTLNSDSHLVLSPAIAAAPSSPVECSSNLVSHIAQTLCPLPANPKVI